jgi:hypothetical protein
MIVHLCEVATAGERAILAPQKHVQKGWQIIRAKAQSHPETRGLNQDAMCLYYLCEVATAGARHIGVTTLNDPAKWPTRRCVFVLPGYRLYPKCYLCEVATAGARAILALQPTARLLLVRFSQLRKRVTDRNWVVFGSVSLGNV